MSATSAALATGEASIVGENLASGDAKRALKKVSFAVGTGAQDVTCARCESSFSCGANASYCWCQTVPALDISQRPADLRERGCLCLRCLRAAVAAQAAD